MSAVPVSPLPPSRRLADLAQSQALRIALAASALAAISLLLARRVDLSSLAQADVVWGWIIASLLLNLASVAGKAIVWKAALDALPGQRPVRYGHVVPGALHRFPAQLGPVRPCRRARARRGARSSQASGRGEHSCFDDRRHRACRATRPRRRARPRGGRARAGHAPAAHDLAARDRLRARAGRRGRRTRDRAARARAAASPT